MERLTGGDDDVQWAIHTYRYEVAARFTKETDTVLDAACGIGYGKEILHGAWVGADRAVDVPLLVDLNEWVPDFEFDVFVGLETIEHLEDFGMYVHAAKQARRTIVISTPIIPTMHFNPFHLHDFTPGSLRSLFYDWEVLHYEAQIDPLLEQETYGIWAFGR